MMQSSQYTARAQKRENKENTSAGLQMAMESESESEFRK